MPDEPDPPRKFYEFKPREFEAVNPPAKTPQPIAPVDVPNLLRQANSAKPGGVSRHSRHRRADDVHAMLDENLALANSAGLNDLAPLPRRPSRRKRDYLFLVISGNLLFGLLALIAGVGTPIVFVSAIAGMALLTAGLTWIMWFVMDDY